MNNQVVPIAQLSGRRQEMGRIRFGEKAASGAPKALKTFRFTSPDQEAIRQVADLYGGEPSIWEDPKADPPRQWQVTTTASSIRVFLPPGGLDQSYEQWTGRGCQRRCDGVIVEVPNSGPGGPWREAPCMCKASGTMVCKPKTRLQVMLPEVRFAGVWRLETSSWNALHEMPAMEEMAQLIQLYGVIEATLSLVERSTESGRRKFVVPRIEFATSAKALVEGAARVAGSLAPGSQGALDGAPPPSGRALGPGASESPADVTESARKSTSTEWWEPDDPGRPFTPEYDDVVEAEIVSEGELEPSTTERTATVIDVEEEPFTTVAEDVAARAEAAARRAGADVDGPPAWQRKLHALVGQLAKSHAVNADDLRHRCVRTVTRGRSESSKDLQPDEVDRLLDALEEVIAGERTLTFTSDAVRMPKVSI